MPRSRPDRQPPPPLDQPALERVALRYLERFSTTRARLSDHLRRKLRERGWAGDRPPEVDALVERLAGLGYVDDRAWAEAKGAALGRRGFGARRVAEALRHAGVDGEDAAPAAETADEEQWSRALAFARRKRIGPFAAEPGDRAAREKALGALLRAGHAMPVARAIAMADPGDDLPEGIA